MTVFVTTVADQYGRRRVLIIGAALMALAGAVFALTDSLAMLSVAAVLGTISPSGKEVGPFLSVEQAVRKMTSLPAKKLGLKDRGVIRVGAKADLVAFNAKTVTDRATYAEPHQYAAGIEYVLVNGRLVIKGGEHTGSLPGRVLTPP